MWDELERYVRGTLNPWQLSDVLIKDWNNLHEGYIQNLIQSMGRCQVILQFREGSNTEYLIVFFLIKNVTNNEYYEQYF